MIHLTVTHVVLSLGNCPLATTMASSNISGIDSPLMDTGQHQSTSVFSSSPALSHPRKGPYGLDILSGLYLQCLYVGPWLYLHKVTHCCIYTKRTNIIHTETPRISRCIHCICSRSAIGMSLTSSMTHIALTMIIDQRLNCSPCRNNGPNGTF